MNTSANLPLSGIRVLEFGHMVMGPSCGMILADMGAEVIKVEPNGKGDKTRYLGAFGTGFHSTFNRNKKSIAIDLKSELGKQAIFDLIKSADVVTENFREGSLEKQGLGYEELKKVNPSIVYCSMKGFLNGPYQHRTALDEVVQMMGGLAFMTGLPGKPLRAGASVNDIMGGMFGAIAILGALVKRRETGEGAFVKAGLFENCALLMAQHIASYEHTGIASQPLTMRKSQPWPVYDLFDTKNDQKIFIGLVTDSQWENFCKEFELNDLLDSPQLQTNEDRVSQRDTILLPRLRELVREFTLQALSQRLDMVGCPFAPIAKPEDLINDKHLNASEGMLPIEINGKAGKIPGLPMEYDNNRFGLRRQPPLVGEHSRDTLSSVGYSEEQLNELIKEQLLTVSMRNAGG